MDSGIKQDQNWGFDSFKWHLTQIYWIERDGCTRIKQEMLLTGHVSDENKSFSVFSLVVFPVL